jgi:hypothetical protein
MPFAALTLRGLQIADFGFHPRPLPVEIRNPQSEIRNWLCR